jgi:outer membrane autotransporter protein
MATEVTTRRGVEAGDTRMTAVSGGGYWTSLGARGWYVDARALASAYAASSTSFQDVEFDTTGLGVAASLEAGYPLALAPGLVLEPQLQAVAQGLWLGDGNDGYADVSFEDAASLATRAGLRIAYTRDGATGFGVTVWARGDVWHDWLEPAPEVRFSSADGPVGFHSETDATWLAARIGVSARDSERLQLHGSLGAERSADGNGFAMDARVGAVWRF